jgi:hypothetical protein
MASQAGNLLGMGTTAAGDLASIASGSRKESNALHMQSAAAVGDLGSTALDTLFG